MLLVQILGQLIGIFLFVGIIVLIIKQKGFHPNIFELEEGEEIIKMAKGDYWESCLLSESQNSGEFAFTNKRIIFKGTFLNSSNKYVSIPYENIVSIDKALVKIFPVAIKIKTIDNETYKFALMKRDIYIDLITSCIQKNKAE